MRSFRLIKPWLLATVVFATAGAIAPSAIAEEMTWEKLNMPVPVAASTRLTTAETRPDDAFQFAFTDTVCREGRCIPQGTLLQGHIKTIRQPRRFHVTAFITAVIDDVRFPDGTHLTPLAGDSDNDNVIKLRNGQSVGFGRTLALLTVGQLPSLIVPGLLSHFTNMSTKNILLTTAGAGLAVDVGQELAQPTFPGSSIPKRIGTGVLNTFYIGDMIAFVKRQPGIDIPAEKKIPIQFSKPFMRQLFAAAPTATLQIQAQIKQPVAPLLPTVQQQPVPALVPKPDLLSAHGLS